MKMYPLLAPSERSQRARLIKPVCSQHHSSGKKIWSAPWEAAVARMASKPRAAGKGGSNFKATRVPAANRFICGTSDWLVYRQRHWALPYRDEFLAMAAPHDNRTGTRCIIISQAGVGFRPLVEARGRTHGIHHLLGRRLWPVKHCVSVIFVSYTGESLDAKHLCQKTIVALDKAAVDMPVFWIKIFPNATEGWGTGILSSLDAGLAIQRWPALYWQEQYLDTLPCQGQPTGRPLFRPSPKRIYAFMRDFWRIINFWHFPLRTRHNEVARTMECSSLFAEEINLAAGHKIDNCWWWIS